VDEVLGYLRSLPEPQRGTLSKLREDLLALVPGATEGFSYSMPAVILNGKAVAGYFAFKNHLGYFPHSSLVTPQLEKDLANYKVSKGGFQFPHDHHLPRELIEKLVVVRLKVLKEQYPSLFV
jgi:uncharacterized protein YdhG (YjbR/CyaY superfamily)